MADEKRGRRGRKYEFVGVLKDGAAWADRQALAAVGAVRPDVETADRLLTRWRARVCALRRTGWEPLADGANFVRVLNCPPVGVFTRPPQRPCERALICPFCWCRRYVHDLYQRLLAFYGDESRQHHPLLEIHWAHDYSMKKWSLQDLFYKELHVFRRYFMDLTKAIGGFRLISVQPPTPKRKAGHWHVEVRFAGILPADGHTPYVPQERHTWDRHETPTKRTLVDVVGRVCQYPGALLWGPLRETIQLLHFVQGKKWRASATYGALRHSTILPDFISANEK